MAYASWTGTGDDTTREFDVPFPYVKKEHLVVTINYVATTAYSWVNDGRISFDALSGDTTTQKASGAPKTGMPIIIKRGTSLGTPLVDFVDGSTLTAADLDTANLQVLYATQELDDVVNAGVAWSPQGLDANNQPVINVQDPTNAQDAVTKTYADGLVTGVLKADGTVNPTANLPMNAKRLTGLADPVDAQDAVTKAHYDAGIGTAAASATAAAASATSASTSANTATTYSSIASSYATQAQSAAKKTHMYGFKKDSEGKLLMDYSLMNEKHDVVYKKSDYQYKGVDNLFIGFGDMFYDGVFPMPTNRTGNAGWGEAKWGSDGGPLRIWVDADGHLKMLLQHDDGTNAADDAGDEYTMTYPTIDCSSTAKQYFSFQHPADVDNFSLENYTQACTLHIEPDTRSGKSPIKSIRAAITTQGSIVYNPSKWSDVYSSEGIITISLGAPSTTYTYSNAKYLSVEGWRGEASNSANGYAMLGTVKKVPYLGDYSIRVTT